MVTCHSIKNALFLLGGALVVSSTARAADPVIIVSPKGGEVVPPSFSVNITYGKGEYCDTDGCTELPLDSVDLYADTDDWLAGCYPGNECPPGEVSFDVMLDPGPHDLHAWGGLHGPIVRSMVVEITVEEETETSGDGDSASSTGDPAGKDGCACNPNSDPESGAALLGLAAVLITSRCRSRAY